MPASDYLQKKLAEHSVGKTAFTMPTNVYIALCTASISSSDTGSTITEASYTSYARVETSGTDWSTYTSGELGNSNALSFPECTGSTSDATHFAVLDASSSGNLYFYDALDASLSISAGITPSFAEDTLTLSVT